MTVFRKISRVALLLLPVVLSACGDSGTQEVRQWMEEVRKQTPVSISKLPAPKKFTPFTYDAQSAIDPFNPDKLSDAVAKAQLNTGGRFKPDMTRRREVLESYPLDTIRMVGTLEKPGLTYAILQADKAIYQAKVGNYIGQNFGRITRITETEVDITEVVQDASGEWVERQAKLELQEKKNDSGEK